MDKKRKRGEEKHQQTRASAIEALKSARQGGNRRSEQFSSGRTDDDVLVDVTEEQYRKHVEERKLKGSFVVDDKTGEYEDDGEDRWDGAFYEADISAVPKKRGKTDGDDAAAAAGAGAGAGGSKAPQGPGRLAEMFSKPKSAPKTATAATLSRRPRKGDGADEAVDSGDAEKEKKAAEEEEEEEEDADLKDLIANPTADGILHRAKPQKETAAPPPQATDQARRPPPPRQRQQQQQREKTTQEPPPTVIASEDSFDAAFVQAADEAARRQLDGAGAAAAAKAPDEDLRDEDLAAIDLSRFVPKEPDKDQPVPQQAPAEPVVRPGQRLALPLDGHGNLMFYWLDAAEFVSAREPGAVHLFGKVFVPDQSRHVSCCLVVRGVPRIVYAVPRGPLLDDDGRPTELVADMLEELDEIRARERIQELRSKPVMRNYAFDLDDVPRGSSSFMKIRLPPGASLPKDLSGRTFSRILGSTAGPLEHVVLKCSLRGPEWLYVVRPRAASPPTTWCALEVEVDDYKAVIKPEGRTLPAAPLVVVGIGLKTVMNRDKHEAEVAVASLCVEAAVSVDGGDAGRGRERPRTYTAVRKLGGPFPLGFARNPAVAHVHQSPSERDLLSWLFATLQNVDPDVIVGHNVIGFDIDVLLHRARACGDQTWSKLGRLRLSAIPRQGLEATACRGRLICDTYVMAKELIFKQKSYRLAELAETQLGEPGHISVDPEDVAAQYENSDRLASLVRLNEDDARLVMRLAERVKMLSLTKQLTSLVGNVWSRTLGGHRAERVEFLLLHEFHRLKFIPPDRRPGPSGPGAGKRKKKAAYSGGMVLEPRVGFYDRLIVLLDFKSLYPSLIQEFNVCFTTVLRKPAPPAPAAAAAVPGKHAEEQLPWIAEPPEKDTPEGILPRVVRSLVEQRRRVRSQMEAEKSEPAKAALNIRQSALKLVANSLYGCLGFEFSRFHARPLAELITRKGRETLQKSMELVTGLGLAVIYGDTDSLMVNTGTDDLGRAREMARRVIKEINQRYKSLEIDIDNVYRRMLLLKKKNYACIEAESGKRQIKGIHLVRRDWCDLSKEMGEFVLDRILSSAGSRDEVSAAVYAYLREMHAKIRAGQVEPDKFGITKSLSKDPGAYDDAKSQPHVQAAKVLLAQGKKLVSGDFVTYVICKSESGGGGAAAGAGAGPAAPMAQRAFPVDSVKRDKSLEIDVDWYLGTQLFPPIVRLCRPIEEIDISQVAECLGLDPTKHVVATRAPKQGAGDGAAGMDARQFTEIVDALSNETGDPLRALHGSHFALAEQFLVRCPRASCLAAPPVAFAGLTLQLPAGQRGGTFPDSALCCPRCKKPYGAAAVGNQLVLFARSLISRHYRGVYACQSAMCQRPSRTLLLRHTRVEGGERLRRGIVCPIPGCKSDVDEQYNSSALYYSFIHLRSLFDAGAIPRASARPFVLTPQQQAFFSAVWRRIDALLQRNSHHFFPLSIFDINAKIVAPAAPAPVSH